MDLTTTFPVFGTATGWWVLALYATVVLSLTTWFVRGYADSKNSFLVARREVGGVAGAMSISAAWAWAPSMFISSQVAYQNGIAGLFWFTLGNFLTLILFSVFAQRIRERQPEGFTLSGYVRERFSGRVQAVFLIELVMLAICAFAINVLAGSKALQTITGIDYHVTTFVLAALALTYTLRGGLKASVITEMFKIAVLWIGVLVLVPWAWSAGDFSAVVAGLGGITGQGAGVFHNEFALGVMMGVGLSMTLGHFGAPWGDQSFYQRAFAIRRNSIVPAFVGGALLFVLIPLGIGSLGFMMAGMGIEIPKDQVGMTTVLAIGQLLPDWTVLALMFMLFAGLVGVLDSQLSSAASLAGHDLRDRFSADVSDANSIWWSRAGMLGLAVIALIIANWPGITMLTIFLFFGVLRATVWWPMMLHLINPSWISERGMFWGIVLAFLIGFPMFVYGSMLGGGAEWTMTGTLISIFGSGLIAAVISYVDTTKHKELVWQNAS